MPSAGPPALSTAVFEAIDAFVGDAPQFDDITMLVLSTSPLAFTTTLSR